MNIATSKSIRLEFYTMNRLYKNSNMYQRILWHILINLKQRN